MTNILRDPRDRAGKIDEVAEWFNSRSQTQAFGLVLTTIGIVSVLDYYVDVFESCIATLYIVPICLSCWMFEAHRAIVTTMIIAIIALVKYPLMNQDAVIAATISNGVPRVLSFVILAAIILAFRRNYDLLQLMATRDEMTGVLNKRAFHDRTKEMLAAAHRTGHSVLLAYVDLDGFKRLNDLYGHHIGDEVLRSFSIEGGQQLRSHDCFGRVGGDEFAIGVCLEPGQEALAVAKSLHRRFSSVLAGTGHAVTCSMGVVIAPPSDHYVYEELVQLADQLMYAAKHDGKNAVSIATAHTETGRETLHSSQRAMSIVAPEGFSAHT